MTTANDTPTKKAARHNHTIELADRRLVTRTAIIGTPTVMLRLWEPCEFRGFDNGGYTHGSFTHYNGELYGEVATRNLPDDIEALPAMSDERIEAAMGFRFGLYAECYKVLRDYIVLNCDAHETSGEIRMTIK